MSKAPMPTKEQVLAFIQDSPERASKREIARAFRLDANQRPLLRTLLKDLEAEGRLDPHGRRKHRRAGTLPEVMVLVVDAPDADGEVMARPMTWNHEVAPPPIYVRPGGPPPAPGPGDRVLARLERLPDASGYAARVMRRIGHGPNRVLGILEETREHGRTLGRLRPTDRRSRNDFLVAPDDFGGARVGDLVQAEALPARGLGPRRARVVERLGAMDDPRAVSLIAIQTHDIPHRFREEALAQAEAATAAPLAGRTDLRALPLVTIDGADARDFDDAVFAEPDDDPENPGGFHLVVAIADVAWYVRPGDALDRTARERGNSVYFPDRVVPMLPEALSNGWCSLRPREDRPCLAAHLWISAEGTLRRHRFERALMRSAARLTYTQVQATRDGAPDDTTDPLQERLASLYAANAALETARRRRGVLELDLPERQVQVNEAGQVTAITTRARYESHRLIENFMVLANVAAAETLEKRQQPCMYRIHEAPMEDRVVALKEFLESLDIRLPGSTITGVKQFNHLIERVADTPHADMVQQVILRTQAQARYSPDNLGHFGLGLPRYAHFTSPIRRYADLLVHRALIRGLSLGEGGLPAGADETFEDTADHISATERRAAAAEREAVDRFTALYLAGSVGATFAARINGATRFGLFVTLAESGADGLIPIATLPRDFYDHDDVHHCLVGRDQGLVFRLGDPLTVKLMEASPVTGGMTFELVEAPEAHRPPPGGRKAARRARPTGAKGKARNKGKNNPGPTRRKGRP